MVVVRNNLKIVVIVIASGFIVALFSLLFVFSATKSTGLGSNEVEFQNVAKKYRYYQYNPTSGDAEVGFMTLLREVGEEGYFYKDEEADDYFLVSNFGSREYKCTGTCSCVNDRRSSSVMTRGVIYLVSAVTGVLAIESAQKYYESECKERLENECSSTTILSEVESCESVKKDAVEEEEEEEEQAVEDVSNMDSFRCTGICQESKFPIDEMVENWHLTKEMTTNMEEAIKNSICESYTMTQEINLKPKKIAKSRKDLLKLGYEDGFGDEKIAEITFLKDHFKDFCEEQVRFDISDSMTLKICEAGIPKLLEMDPECVELGDVPNPTIHCIQMVK